MRIKIDFTGVYLYFVLSLMVLLLLPYWMVNIFLLFKVQEQLSFGGNLYIEFGYGWFIKCTIYLFDIVKLLKTIKTI